MNAVSKERPVPESRVFMDSMREANADLARINARIESIRANLFGPSPALASNKTQDGKTSSQSFVGGMRCELEECQRHHSAINDMLSEIENFI